MYKMKKANAVRRGHRTSIAAAALLRRPWPTQKKEKLAILKQYLRFETPKDPMDIGIGYEMLRSILIQFELQAGLARPRDWMDCNELLRRLAKAAQQAAAPVELTEDINRSTENVADKIRRQ